MTTRAEARAAGLLTYSNGVPCPKGHVGDRRVVNGGCVECSREICRRKSQRRRERDPEGGRKRNQEWRAKNPEYGRNLSRQWRIDNPERVKNRARPWYKTDAGRLSVKASSRRRRALKSKAEGSYTTADVEAIRVRQGNCCANPCCRVHLTKPGSMIRSTDCTEDHVVPLTRGGSNWPDNIQLLCFSCNSSKHNRTMEEWLGAEGN